MKVRQSEFVEMLEALKPGLSNKDIIEFSDSISFTGEQSISYNDVIAVKYPFESKFKGTVKADKLLQHASKGKGDKEGYLSLKVKKGDLIIQNGRSKAGIPINIDGMVSLDELGKDPSKWKNLPGDFTQAIRLSIFAAGDDQSEPKLTCLHVVGAQVQSSNGHRAFRYQMENKIKKEFLLPATSAPSILNHPIKKYAVTKNWLHFKTKAGVIISTRMYADTSFPDTSYLFEIKGKAISFPDKLRETIDRAVVFIGEDEDDKNIKISIKKKKIKVESESVHGWFREAITTKKGKDVVFEISPFFLQDILKTSTKAKLDPKKGLLKFNADKWEYTINIAPE